MLQVIDLYRIPIGVTDLDEALKQAEEMISYCPSQGPRTEFEKRQLAYWQDLHEKLKAIKAKLNRTKTTKKNL